MNRYKCTVVEIRTGRVHKFDVAAFEKPEAKQLIEKLAAAIDEETQIMAITEEIV